MTLGSPESLVGSSAHPPIADYAFLSDCEVTALVAPSGNVEWLCLPRLDSPSIFGATLDRGAGGFRLGPADVSVPAARRYVPGTMVLETSWGTATGWIIVRDVLLIGPWHEADRPAAGHRRAPTDYQAEHVLLRTVRCVTGEVQVVLECEPMFDYGRRPANWSYTDKGYHQGVARDDGLDLEVTLTTDLRLGFERAGPSPAACSRKAILGSVPSRGVSTALPSPSRRPTGAWCGPPITGSTGWPGGGFQTTRAAAS